MLLLDTPGILEALAVPRSAPERSERLGVEVVLTVPRSVSERSGRLGLEVLHVVLESLVFRGLVERSNSCSEGERRLAFRSSSGNSSSVLEIFLSLRFLGCSSGESAGGNG